MLIDKMIEQLQKLKETYGNIEVDMCDSHCYMATHDDICLRIDEFGDILAVIQSPYGKGRKGKFNQIIQNDSWMQFKDVNMSEKEAKANWMAAGKPSRMQWKDIKPNTKEILQDLANKAAEGTTYV